MTSPSQSLEKPGPAGRQHPLAGARAWIISDGKAGHEVQCRGVAQALGLDVEIKRIAASGIFHLAAPWGPVSPFERFGAAGTTFAPPWPRIALAAGRTTIPYIRALKRRAGDAVFTVILLDPKTPASSADLIWVPEHDKRRGTNVVTTITSPHGFSAARLAELRKDMPPGIAALPKPRIAVLIGGPNTEYTFTERDAALMARALAGFSASGAGLMISPSRRTPQSFLAAIDAATKNVPRILYDGSGDNPYADFIAHADAFVVTADSINMVGEAAATGRPIYVFEPSGGGGKFAKFHDALRAHGATRPLLATGGGVEPWTYAPLDSAALIADEITRRWRK
jgi:mitochondrial fission protein ELM1